MSDCLPFRHASLHLKSSTELQESPSLLLEYSSAVVLNHVRRAMPDEAADPKLPVDHKNIRMKEDKKTFATTAILRVYLFNEANKDIEELKRGQQLYRHRCSHLSELKLFGHIASPFD